MPAAHSIHIDAPVEKVFDFYRDPRNWAALGVLGDRVEMTHVHVTEEGLGTSYVWLMRILGFRAENFGVFTEFVPNERIVEKSSVAFDGTLTYVFAADGSGTRLTMQRRPRSLWRLWPLGPLVDAFDEPMTERWLAKLKEVMETAAAPARVAG